MSIEAWNIVISAAILGLLTGGGIWLKYVVDQQLKTKDTTIEALDAVAKAKDARIAALEGDTAPAIVKAYADMRKHADMMTEESQKLTAQLAELTQKSELTKQTLQSAVPLAGAESLALAATLLQEHIGSVLFPYGTLNALSGDESGRKAIYEGYLSAQAQINVEAKARIETARMFLKQ